MKDIRKNVLDIICHILSYYTSIDVGYISQIYIIFALRCILIYIVASIMRFKLHIDTIYYIIIVFGDKNYMSYRSNAHCKKLPCKNTLK